MNGHARKGTSGPRRRRIMTIAVATLAVVTGSIWLGARAEASRIRPRGISARSSSAISRQAAWSRFLSGGPARWARTQSPPIPSGARLPIVDGGLLLTPFVDYLLWRRDLNPARFDANHPRVAEVFSQLAELPAIEALATAEPIVSTPFPDVPNAISAAQEIVPEPSGLAIGVSLLGAWAFWRRRHAPKAP